MRLQRNPGSLISLRFVFTCLACGRRADNTEEWFADLDGEPFKAYYCQPCGNAKQILHDRTKGAEHV